MFIKKSNTGMTVHYAAVVADKGGSGRELIQYSYVNLKEDILKWLKQNGRLPSTTTTEYFEEINTLNQLKERVRSLELENKTLKSLN